MRRQTVIGVWIVAVAGAPLSSPVAAGDYGEDALGLRMSAGLSRFSPYADVAAAGGASAGSRWFSSINPASAAWNATFSGRSAYLSPQYSMACFGEDMTLHVPAESVTMNMGEWGSLILAMAQARSDGGRTNQGLTPKFNLDLFQGQYSNTVGEDFAWGGAFTYTRSELQFDWGPLDISDAHSDSYSFRGGALYRPAEKWLVGAVLEFGWAHDRMTVFDLTGFFPDTKVSGNSYQAILRTGVSYEYLSDSCVYVDYEGGWFWDSSDRLQINRFRAGVDHQIWRGVFARAGATIDTEGSFTWTTGFGVAPADWVSIDVAYQYNALPELNHEFGRSQMVVLSAGFSW